MLILKLILASYFTLHLVRSRPMVKDWMRAGRKPWACDLCMSFWSAVLWVTWAWIAIDGGTLASALIHVASVAGACLIATQWTATLEPPEIPMAIALPPEIP